MSTMEKGLVNVSEYKGHAILELKRTEEDKHPFRFGVSKAKLILEHLESIKSFITNNDKDE